MNRMRKIEYILWVYEYRYIIKEIILQDFALK